MNKYILMFSCLLLSLCMQVAGNGIAYYDAEEKIYLDILNSEIDVRVTDQVSVTTITQLFRNPASDSLKIRYAFPLLETASATQLRYKYEGTWYTAAIEAVPQDSLQNGNNGSPGNSELRQYLGDTPLIYDIDVAIPPHDSLSVELTYVELLPYKLGLVSYLMHFNVNSLLYDEAIDCQFHMSLYSQRTINDINLISPGIGGVSEVIYGDSVTIDFSLADYLPADDISVSYELSSDELGLFCLSSFMPDSLVPDDLGNGFFTFIVEPEPQPENQIISKYFTLIIDRSGSMSGQKIVDARDAAIFIVDHLNESDMFNIVSFNHEITSFRSAHVENSIQNRNSAINYIQSLNADGSTNISGAFATAVPQFSSAQENTANIIIFLTDGRQTAGIQDTDELIAYINDLVVESETDLSLFSFGIGSGTNERLLRTISYDNQGLSEFLSNNELESVITEFFLLINNPVLLETSMEFSPDIITELYPGNLPNLYVGQQMIVSGRYPESAETVATLSGTAFGQAVDYNYNPELAADYREEYLFLMKIWAKQKIETLLSEYFKNQGDTSLANPLQREIIEISMAYGVISPFTSYQGIEDDTDVSYSLIDGEHIEESSSLVSNQYCSDLKVLGVNRFAGMYLQFDYSYHELKPGRIILTTLSGQVIAMEDILIDYGENKIDISNLTGNLPRGMYSISLQIESEILSVLFTIQ